MEGRTLSTPKPTTTIKFLCSYGGKILPRYPDGKLRYHGGQIRVLSLDRSISFTELLVKLGELCGSPVTLRCQLPTEDLDALVSITCDEDLANLIEEYDRTAKSKPSSNLKLRAFLSLSKKSYPILSPKCPLTHSSYSPPRSRITTTNNCTHQMSKPSENFIFRHNKSAGNLLRYACVNASQSYLVQSGNYNLRPALVLDRRTLVHEDIINKYISY